MGIGTEEAVASGQYGEEYLREAGRASHFRKEFQRIFNKIKGVNGEEPCPEGKASVPSR
jgi:hypothetical protein